MYGMTAGQMSVVMIAGYELGLTLTGAVDVIYVAKSGRPTLRPKGALGLIRRSGLLEQYDWTSDAKSATVTMKRKGDNKAHSMTLTIEEAQAAGWKSTAWATTPANMLRWRLIGWLADMLFSDVLMGLTIADDSWMDVEITADGDVINHMSPTEPQASSATLPTQVKAPEPVEPEPPALTVADLINFGFKAEDILTANEDKIPETAAECEVVKAKLEAEAAEGEEKKQNGTEV